MFKSLKVIVGATLLLTSTVQAQTIKAKGAPAAGVCSGVLELIANHKSRSGNLQPNELQHLMLARDFFAEMPMFDRQEITANAEAFIRLMTQRIAAAQTSEERKAISNEIRKLSRECFQTAERMMASNPQLRPQARQQHAQPHNPQPDIVNPQPLVQ